MVELVRSAPGDDRDHIRRPTPVPRRVDDETTDPLAQLPELPDERAVAAVRRAGYDANQPVRFVELKQIVDIVKEQMRETMRRERETSDERQARELLEVLNRPTREEASQLLTDIEGLKTFVRKQRRALSWVRRGLVAAVLAVGSWLYYRGVKEGTDAMRLTKVEEKAERCERVLFVPLPTQKGQTP